MREPVRKFSGFTLIEVLMVIAVIGILASILLPVFGNAKMQARKRECASNLQQLGKAFSAYLSDWNGVYPAPGGIVGDYNYWSQTGNGGLVSYVGDNGGIGTIWCCSEQTEWQGKYAARTYSMNSYLRNPPDKEIDYYLAPPNTKAIVGCPENLIEDPHRTILLYEGMPITADWPQGSDYIYRCGNYSCVRGWFTQKKPCLHTLNSWLGWHGNENNYLYCDGHIRTFVPNKTPNKPKIDMSNEWYVQKSYMASRYGPK